MVLLKNYISNFSVKDGPEIDGLNYPDSFPNQDIYAAPDTSQDTFQDQDIFSQDAEYCEVLINGGHKKNHTF